MAECPTISNCWPLDHGLLVCNAPFSAPVNVAVVVGVSSRRGNKKMILRNLLKVEKKMYIFLVAQIGHCDTHVKIAGYSSILPIRPKHVKCVQ